MSQTLTGLLKNKMQAKVKVVQANAQALMSKRGLTLFIQAPDFHLAAAILSSSKFTNKDRMDYYEALISMGESPCAAFHDKLRLLNLDTYHG